MSERVHDSNFCESVTSQTKESKKDNTELATHADNFASENAKHNEGSTPLDYEDDKR